MLVLKKELDLNEFEEEFEEELGHLSIEGVEIVFESLSDTMLDGDYTVTDVRDYLRFKMEVMSLDEVISAYGCNMDLQDLEDDALFDAVEEHLQYHTYLLGSYEDDGITYFIFDEF